MKKNKKTEKKVVISRFAIRLIFLAFILFFTVVILFVIRLKVTHEKNGVNLEDYKINQYEESSVLTATRGTIYDTKGETLASDIKVYDMYAVLDPSNLCYKPDLGEYAPCYVEDPEATAKALADALELDDAAEEFFVEQLSMDGYQVEFGSYGKNLTLSQKEKIDELNLNGIEFEENTIRYYPYGDFASYVLGYAKSIDGSLVGEMGVEEALDGYLDGIDGSETTYEDANGVQLDDVPGIPDSEKIIEPQNGTNVYLTIDSTIQSIVESEVKKAYNQYPEVGFDIAFTIVMDAKNGDILAAYKEPSFDPNVKDIEDYQNPYTEFCFEPGSTMKTITIAVAYENGLWDDTTTYPTGSRTTDNWGGETISDWRPGGWGSITFAEAYYVSANTVTTIIQEKIGNEIWDEYTTGENGFDFGKPVETEFIKTSSCTFDPTYPLEYATSSFGQGVTVNALQMLRAYTAFTNKGVMVTPHIVSQITDPETNEVVYDDDILRDKDKQVISEDTATWVLEQMEGVVNYQSPTNYYVHGSANTYQGSEYPIGSKTGTAEYTDASGNYVVNTYINSTMNVAPVDDPQIIIYTIVKDPTSSLATGTIMPQYVKNITDKTLAYMNSENDVETKELTTGDKVISYVGLNMDEITSDQVIKMGSGEVKSQYPKAGQNSSSKTYIFGDFSVNDYNFVGKSLEEAQAVCQTQDISCEFKGSGNYIDSVDITSEKKYELTLKWG